MTDNKKEVLRAKRHRSIRVKMSGTSERPRLVIRRSLKNFHGQIMNDTDDKVLMSISTKDKIVRPQCPKGGNVKAAEVLGSLFAAKAKDKGITKIVFDRAGYKYHGRVKAFAEALRKGGLEF